MEINTESHVNVNQLLDEEPEENITKPTLVNEDSSHVTTRHPSYGSIRGETGLPFNYNTESPALDSIYRYANKIKSFLGWERDDLECAGNIEESVCRTTEQGAISEAEHVNGFREISNNVEELNGDKETYDIVDDISTHSISESLDIQTSQFNTENLTETDDRKTLELLSLVSENESDFELESDNAAYENNLEQNIFTVEVFITVADYRSEDPSSSVAEFNSSEKDILKSVDMNESLVNNNSSKLGLILNDADDILQNELLSSSSKEEVPDDKSKQNGKVEENLIQSLGEPKPSDNNENFNCDKAALNEFNVKNIVDDLKTCDESTHQSLNCTVQASLDDEVDMAFLCCQNSNEELSNENEHDYNGSLKRNDSHEKELSKENNSQLMKPINANDRKSLTVNSIKASEANHPVTVKASVHYEKEKKSQAQSKGDTNGKNLPCKEISYEDDTACGLGCFRPRWLQPFATPKMYVILYSIIGILHGSYYSYLIGTLSTLEKRFAFRSKISGVIMIADEITPLLLGVILGYLAGRSNRPRMVAFGMLLSAGCCFSSTLPYFIYGPGHHLTVQNVQNHTGPAYCDTNSGKDSCDLDEHPPTVPAVLFLVFGSFLKGFGNLAYYAIGLAYLDDNSEKKTTPIYLAIALALRLLGPLVGFLMSSAFLKLYENPFEDPGFGPDDPRWIGAWWIGFLLQGILLVIFTLPIALFPRVLPGQKRVEKPPSENNKINMKEILTGLVAALKRLGKNPIFILMICNTTMKIFGHFGHSIMLPKYMENQFRLSAADASLFSGAISVFCIMISTVLGGFLIWKYRPRIKVLLGGMVTSEIILCLGFLVLLIPRCEPMDMLNFGVNDEGLILNSACNRNCDCSTKAFTPFCGPDGKTIYFSPCYAGCTEEMRTEMLPKTQTVFGNCSCISGTNSPEASTVTVTEGFCPDENCWSKAIVYLVILFIMLTISNTFTVAHTMILLRSVHPEDKSIALGTFETFICLFGFIPFPVSYGALVDSACLVWEKSCGETGNCWFYDMDKYAYLLHGSSSAFCSLSTICLITLYFLSPRVRDLYAEEDVEESINNIKLDTVSGSATKL